MKISRKPTPPRPTAHSRHQGWSPPTLRSSMPRSPESASPERLRSLPRKQHAVDSLWPDLGTPPESRWQSLLLAWADAQPGNVWRTWRESPDRMMPGLSREHGGLSGTEF